MLHRVKLKIMGWCVCPFTLNWTLLCKFTKWCKFSNHIKVKLYEKKFHKKRPAFIQVCIKWCTNNMFSLKCVNLNCYSRDTSMSVSFLLYLHGWEVMLQFMLLAAYYREDVLMSYFIHAWISYLFFVPFRLKSVNFLFQFWTKRESAGHTHNMTSSEIL